VIGLHCFLLVPSTMTAKKKNFFSSIFKFSDNSQQIEWVHILSFILHWFYLSSHIALTG
jgi:hypothetical protein